MRSIPNQAGEARTRRRMTKTNWQRLLEPASIETLSSSPHATYASCMPGVCQTCAHMREKTPAYPNAHVKAHVAIMRTRSGGGARGIGRRRVVATPVTPVKPEIPLRRRGRGGATLREHERGNTCLPDLLTLYTEDLSLANLCPQINRNVT